MSQELINRSEDLRKLVEHGYELEIRPGYLLVHNVPYVNSRQKISHGILVTTLEQAGDISARPGDHTMHIIGEHPCHADGRMMSEIHNTSQERDLGNGMVIHHTFSRKPAEGYTDYWHKVKTYQQLISEPTLSIDPTVTARTFRAAHAGDHYNVFHYHDMNSARAEIGAISQKLHNLKVAIIGLGGTGAYVLDFVAKTPVREIHLFDKDLMLSHNAFRAPGAASKKQLRQQLSKVSYLHKTYSKMHRYVMPHEEHLTATNLSALDGLDFVFICIDEGEAKKIIVDHLLARGISFIDVGIGVEEVDGALTGGVRTTLVTADKHDHAETRISFAAGGNNDYTQNIQIAELNALNAAMAVIKWKKLYGFYHDLAKEHHSSYAVNVNKVTNDEAIA